MLKLKYSRNFANGTVYAMETQDGYPIEVTDTFLPYYTKDAIGSRQNKLQKHEVGSRLERWMIGVSCMSGCPVGCKFCATGQLKRWRRLTAEEIVDQVSFVIRENYPVFWYDEAMEFKINYTRMGEPFLNAEAIKETVERIEHLYIGTQHYISTIGIKDSDFSWIKNNITLQISLHSLNAERRRELVPFPTMTIEELGKIRTDSYNKTTLNLTLVDEADFDIKELKKYFDPEHFFIKLSPINVNPISADNQLGEGIIEGINLL